MAALRGAAVPAMPDAFGQPRLLDRSTIGEPQLSTRASFASKALAPDHAPMKAMLAFAPLAARPNMWEAVRWSSSEAKEGEKKKAEGEWTQGFVKAVLDVADNLERAAAVVPPEALEPHADGKCQSAMDLKRCVYC
eukprot:gene29647-5062_t